MLEQLLKDGSVTVTSPCTRCKGALVSWDGCAVVECDVCHGRGLMQTQVRLREIVEHLRRQEGEA